MASDDIYLRKDVYEADQRAAKAESRLGYEEILKAINQFKGEVNSRFDKLEAKVEVLTGRVDGLEKRMDSFEARLDSIQTYVGIGIAFVTMVITLYTFLAPVMKAAKNFLNHLTNEKKHESSPGLTAEQVREIFHTEAEAIIDSKLKAIR